MSSRRDIESLRFLYRDHNLTDDEQDDLDTEKGDLEYDIQKNDLKEKP